jgi:4-amino-4-deoxy-L-arabinose transferase-like glycosyltransferase
MPNETLLDSAEVPSTSISWFDHHSVMFDRGLLMVLTLACLAPFLGKAFNIDDPLFVWVAKHITRHPLDPYGFSVDWYVYQMPISQITKNPPLASYYSALIGAWSHWKEVALHLAFLIPAMAVVLGTYELGRGLTQRPVLAGVLTLVAPGFLVSATSVMCDVLMLSFWLASMILWRKGVNSGKSRYLALAGLLAGVCGLTKYFGVSLVPLLFVYAFFRRKTVGTWALYLTIPVAFFAGYQFWTKAMYGEGLLLGAANYGSFLNDENVRSFWGGLLMGLSFTGGCMLPALLFGTMLFRRIWVATGFALAALGAGVLTWGGLETFKGLADRQLLAAHLLVFIAGGLFVVAFVAIDAWHRRGADSLLLSAWAIGTFVFTFYVNWTVNARSVLPLIPATAILICRRVDDLDWAWLRSKWILAVPVLASASVSLWLATADVALANSAKQAAILVEARAQKQSTRVFFSGHWGFQYYMESLGGRPAEFTKQADVQPSDLLVQPDNNTNPYSFPLEIIASWDSIDLDVNHWITPVRHEMGAGFYSSTGFGPLPFAFGRVPPERYMLLHLKPAAGQR